MTKEEIIQAAQKAFAYQFEIGSKAPLEVREGFIKGAEWMQAKMQETNEGQALLYAVEKTAERTKREMIEKAVEWIRTNWREYINGPDKDGCIAFAHWENDFRRAMEDEV